jgi:hypothetical protein
VLQRLQKTAKRPISCPVYLLAVVLRLLELLNKRERTRPICCAARTIHNFFRFNICTVVDVCNCDLSGLCNQVHTCVCVCVCVCVSVRPSNNTANSSLHNVVQTFSTAFLQLIKLTCCRNAQYRIAAKPVTRFIRCRLKSIYGKM